MIICADENVSPVLSDLIREALLRKGDRLDTVDDIKARGKPDEIWVRTFAAEGGGAILGGDAAMTTKPHEIIAIMETGLRLVIMPAQWSRARRHVQIAFLFFWWPVIEEHLARSKPRDCVQLPWGFDPREGLKRIPLDEHRARQRAKKAERPRAKDRPKP